MKQALCIVAILSCALTAATCSSQRRALAPTSEHSADFDPRILQIAKSEDRKAMRQLAWTFLAFAPKQPGTERRAIWENWTKKQQILKGMEDHRDKWSVSDLDLATQFISLASMSKNGIELDRQALDQTQPRSNAPASDVRRSADLAGFIRVDVRVNDIAARHIYCEHLNQAQALKDKLANPPYPQIKPFERGSATVKAIWWPVKKNKPAGWIPGTGPDGYGPFSCVPVWDGVAVTSIGHGINGQAGEEAGNDFSRWPRLVAVDTESKSDGKSTAEVTHRDWSRISSVAKRQRMPVIPLKRFHVATLNDEKDLEAARSLFLAVHQKPAEAGDAIILVGAHIALKELKDWIWITYWWHDKPDEGAHSAHRIDKCDPWKNYLMDVTYREDTPGKLVEGERPVFNPWLEAPFSGGLRSNCTSCHQRATWMRRQPLPRRLPGPAELHGMLVENDPWFQDKLNMDYVWFLSEVGQ